MAEGANYIVVVHGRGVLYTCLMKGVLEEIAEKCEVQAVKAGFEVHIYSLKLSSRGTPTILGPGFNLLEREWHLWDATEEFEDKVKRIVDTCDEHTIPASKVYLQRCVDTLKEEIDKLDETLRALGEGPGATGLGDQPGDQPQPQPTHVDVNPTGS